MFKKRFNFNEEENIDNKELSFIQQEFARKLEEMKEKELLTDEDIDNVFSNFDNLINRVISEKQQIDGEFEDLPTDITTERAEQSQNIMNKQENLTDTVYKMIGDVNGIENLTESFWKSADDSSESLNKRIKILEKQEQLNNGLSSLYSGLLHNKKGEVESGIDTLVGEKTPQSQTPDGTPTGMATNIDNTKPTFMSNAQKAITLGLDNYTKLPDSLKILNNAVNPSPISSITDKFAKNIYMEYYRYSLNGVNVDEKNNKKYTIGNIDNDRMKNFIKNKYGIDNNSIVVEAKNGSPLNKAITKSDELKQTLLENYSEIKSGKYKDKSIDLNYTKGDLFPTLGKCVLYNPQINTNGDLTGYIIDNYDFKKNNYMPFTLKNAIYNETTYVNNNAYRQQQSGQLENYAIIVPINIKVKK